VPNHFIPHSLLKQVNQDLNPDQPHESTRSYPTSERTCGLAIKYTRVHNLYQLHTVPAISTSLILPPSKMAKSNVTPPTATQPQPYTFSSSQYPPKTRYTTLLNRITNNIPSTTLTSYTNHLNSIFFVHMQTCSQNL
jgi:hypothetical protein